MVAPVVAPTHPATPARHHPLPPGLLPPYVGPPLPPPRRPLYITHAPALSTPTFQNPNTHASSSTYSHRLALALALASLTVETHLAAPAGRHARASRHHEQPAAGARPRPRGDPERPAPAEPAEAVVPPGGLQRAVPPAGPVRRGAGAPPVPPPRQPPGPGRRRARRGGLEPGAGRLPARARGRARHRLPRAAPARGVPAGLRVLQAGPRARGDAGDVHAAVGGGGRVHGGEPGVPAQDPGAVGTGAGDLLPRGRAQLAAQPLHGGGPRRGGGRHVRRHRPGARQDGRQGQGHRGGRGELQPLQPHAVAVRHDRQPLQAPRERRQLQPRRHGMQRRPHLHRPRKAAAAGAPEHLRAGGEHGEHHAELVLGQQPLHAHVQLPVPHGRRGGAADEPRRRGAPPGQVPAGAHGADAPGRGGPRVPVRVPGGGRGGARGRGAVQGPDGRGGGGAQDQHHHAGAAGAAHVGADHVPGVAGGAPGVRRPRPAALHPGLQDGVRALLHPRRRPRRARHHREQPRAQRLAHGAVADDAVPVGQHLQQLALVRAGVHGGAGPRAPRAPRVADRLRVRVQVQQRRVARAAHHRPRRGDRRQPLGGRDPQVPRRGAQGGGRRRPRRRRDGVVVS